MNEITNEEFYEKLFCLNREGDPSKTLKIVNHTIEDNLITWKGNKVNFEFICKSYKQYSDWWDQKWLDTPSRFIPKEDTKKNIYNFLSFREFNKIFEIPKKGRDYYFFGDRKIKNLIEQLKEFKLTNQPMQKE